MAISEVIGFISTFILILGRLITYAIIARIITSWLSVSNYDSGPSKLNQILFEITEPFLRLARKIPHRIGMIDLAPLIAIVAIDLSTELFVQIITNF